MAERTIRHRDDGPPGFSRYADSISTEPGDEISVDGELAKYLVDEKRYFEYVDDGPTADSVDSDEEAEAEDDPDDADDSEDSGDEDGGDEGSYEFDEDSWFEDHDDYESRIERVESGDVDDHLDTIADIESSEQVKDSIGVRRAEVEG
ncbi:hypothetical protein PhiCh1p13 [Natrialba phage PhiCh1]|uniref:Virus protein phiCh1-VP12 n=2 Tax=root TaxID=1 RepID=D3T2G0_NATMM|nr:hypothetical protein [Natrialba magadii]NP_665930.1 hypothetical protein PhiCh1p13 [Natrialba phage PhiCh1]YP_010078042.1 uncharacterized protein KMC42_gp12 [Natrialba phage PhiCh1]AAM88686.1 unknown [Natrialba phage PhiCh1]ADD07769.1 virus protein phiCh1-VP12 [Natrialba magadii ATCC 43099]ELY23016.1 hypothetical protein C500_21170 [Natrialba magadii ATCC 43099]QBJ01193.1 uncharacterized protein PhiCh1_055 [Natrialba phage PhiCh1]